MTSGAHDDGELGEVFLKLGKQGSTLAGVMDAFSIAVSIGLQYGVPLETYVSKFTNLSLRARRPDRRRRTSGWRSRSWTTSSAASPWTTWTSRPARLSASTPPTSASATSRRAPTRPIPEVGNAAEVIGDLSAPTSAESTSSVEPVETSRRRAGRDLGRARRHRRPRPKPAPKEAHTSAELLEKITGTAVDSPLCMTCGTKMRPAGSCYVCEGCGSTSGCS